MDILNEDGGWRPGITVKQALIGKRGSGRVYFYLMLYNSLTVCRSPLSALIPAIQDLLTAPNLNSPAQHDAYTLLSKNPPEYRRRVRQEAAKNRPEA